MTNDDELTKYMVLIEQYKEQLNTLETQSSYLQVAINDYAKAKITLQNLEEADKESDILLPVGGNTFIEAKTKNTSNVLIDIGGGLITEKKPNEAIKKIDKRIEDLQKNIEKIEKMMQQLQNEATEVSVKAQQMIQEQQK
jgi:prefoldin alpha subunit